QRLGGRQDGYLRVYTRELAALHLQAEPQRIPPADISPPVGVIADPARQDDGAWVELGPTIRPCATCHRQQPRVELIDCVAAVGDRAGRLSKFLCQGDRWRPM